LITILLPSIVICSLLTMLTVMNLTLRKYLQPENNDLVDEIESMLPQTQCAQCGYPGCRPYANSITQGESIDLCLPGGPETQRKLSTLMQRIPTTNLPEQKEVVALIDEKNCIGCTLCLPPCPVDAIVGSKNHVHTVLKSECTGCELCLEACPVDCIEIKSIYKPSKKLDTRQKINTGSQFACINCNQCDRECPVNISPLLLHKLILKKDYNSLTEVGLKNCIECGICDFACPSGIPLTDQFRTAKDQVNKIHIETEHKADLLIRYERHQTRIDKEKDKELRQRSARLGDKRPWL